ncbi:MAG: septum site-determining protein MinC [Clostridiales bacterium]|nr:septum site-determining protein MinC [Clostridiales bacterium]
MNQSVMIKGTKSGIILVLDQSIDFESLKEQIADKFRTSSDFLGEATMALSFEGRVLSNDEQMEVLDIIHQNSRLHIVCVVETNPQTEALLEKSLQEKLFEMNANSGQFYKGNLRSGQVLESETSIIVIGDVKPGAKVVSKGNIIVLGSLKGNAFAGASGNENAFVLALDMSPVQIRIADVLGRAPDEVTKTPQRETKVAYIENGNIYIEPFTKDVMDDIRFFKS